MKFVCVLVDECERKDVWGLFVLTILWRLVVMREVVNLNVLMRSSQRLLWLDDLLIVGFALQSVT